MVKTFVNGPKVAGYRVVSCRKISRLMDAHTIEETLEQYDRVFSRCAELFEAKTADYGTAWRILRPSSLTDQLFIKANRIRTLQQSDEAMVDEGIDSEFIGIVNYSLMAMIQCGLPADHPMELPLEEARVRYRSAFEATRSLMIAKNHDYNQENHSSPGTISEPTPVPSLAGARQAMRVSPPSLPGGESAQTPYPASADDSQGFIAPAGRT